MLFARRHSLDSHTRFVGWLLVFVLSWHSALFPALAASRCGDSLTTRDAKGQVTRMGYDLRGRMNRRVLPDGQGESMVYDALGQLRQKTDFQGDTTTFDYDVRGRMTLKRPAQRLLDAGDVAVTMSYTGENLKVVKRGTLTTTYTSDANRGWLSSVSGPSGTIQYGYDSTGLRTSVSADGGITAYSYDELGRMKTVSDKPTGSSAFKLLATYSYDAVGNLQSTVTSNGASAPLATTRYSYDDLNRLGSMSHRRGLAESGALMSGYDYSVRADGKRTGLAETVTGGDGRVSNRTVGFSYDDAGRLTQESGKDGEGVAYRLNWKLDDVGNRTLETRLRAKDAASTDFAGGTLSRTISNYSASGTDWLSRTSTSRGATNAAGTDFSAATTDTATSYGYDDNGAQTRKTTGDEGEGFEWDFEGHLTRVEKGEANATRFTYDASGNRIQTLTRSGTSVQAVNFLVDENTSYAQVLEERDATGVLGARYVYGQGFGPLLLQRVQKNTSGTDEVRTRFLLADGHGSVRQLIDEVGVVTDSYFYDAWGNALAGGSGNTVNPYRYNGQQTDAATGGYFLRARYYQPGTGRFLGHDPMMGSGDDPVSLHRYLYANSDGVNIIDPSGRSSIAESITVNTIVATLVSAVTVGGIYSATGGSFWEGASIGARLGFVYSVAFYGKKKDKIFDAVLTATFSGLSAIIGENLLRASQGKPNLLTLNESIRLFISSFTQSSEATLYSFGPKEGIGKIAFSGLYAALVSVAQAALAGKITNSSSFQDALEIAVVKGVQSCITTAVFDSSGINLPTDTKEEMVKLLKLVWSPYIASLSKIYTPVIINHLRSLI